MGRMLFTALLAAIGAGAHAGETDLIGTYTSTDQKGTREVLRIERGADGYVRFDKAGNGSWRKDPQPLKPVTKAQFEKMLRRPVDVPFDGLANKGMAVFKVPAGWGQDKFRTDSGYFIVFGLGPIALQKKQ